MSGFRGSVIRVLRSLRPGEVVSYGEVAAQAGHPGAARAVGNLLRDEDGLPWWRVVTADGRLAPGHEMEQARRLRREGVEVHGSRVSVVPMFHVIEAFQVAETVRTEVVGRFATEQEAVSYARGQQQVNRESGHLWFVRPADGRPTWVVDENGLRRRPTGTELEIFFA